MGGVAKMKRKYIEDKYRFKRIILDFVVDRVLNERVLDKQVVLGGKYELWEQGPTCCYRFKGIKEVTKVYYRMEYYGLNFEAHKHRHYYMELDGERLCFSQFVLSKNARQNVTNVSIKIFPSKLVNKIVDYLYSGVQVETLADYGSDKIGWLDKLDDSLVKQLDCENKFCVHCAQKLSSVFVED